MSSGIYAIRNKVNNKIYIGSASNIKKRFSTHKNNLKNNRHPNIHLQNAWNKYGESAFEFEVIEYVDSKILVKKEQEYIDALMPQYNKRVVANSNLGIKQSISQIEKRVARLIGHPFWGLRKQTEETKKKVSASLMGNSRTLGHTLSDEHKLKVGLSHLGRKHSEESKKKMALAATGRVVSEETKQKLSRINKGSKRTKDTIKKIIAGLTGRKVSKETRSKISNSLKKRNGGQ